MLISGTSEDLPEYIKKTTIPNLYIVSRGTAPPNPSELLNSSSCKKLINIFRENFDRVIFDGVPVNGLPDSLVLANLVDRVIIVTTIGYTSIDELNQTKKALEQIDAINENVTGWGKIKSIYSWSEIAKQTMKLYWKSIQNHKN